MYSKDEVVSLPASASALFNNLCYMVKDNRYFGVIHKNDFLIVSPRNPNWQPVLVSPKIGSNCPQIAQASWVAIEADILLVLATTGGIFVYEWDGSLLLFSHLLPKPDPEDCRSYARGIAILAMRYLCIGLHTGEVLLFSSNGKGNMNVYQQPKLHLSAITALASKDSHLVSADDAGTTVLSEENGGLQKLYHIESFGYPATCLSIWKEEIIIGYLSGHIRIFAFQDGNILAEVCGHARGVTSMSIASENGLLISVSEDSFARVWQLFPPSENDVVEHKHSTIVENTMLYGVSFTDCQGLGYAVSAYDLSDVQMFAM